MKKPPKKKSTSRRAIRRKQRARSKPPDTEGKEAPAIDENVAEQARRMNKTLWDHLPVQYTEANGTEIAWGLLPDGMRQYPRHPVEERKLAIFATSNILRRIKLDYPDDILSADPFADATFDLVEAMGETFSSLFEFLPGEVGRAYAAGQSL